MSEIEPVPEIGARRLVCARCGTEFGCDLSGNCWCAAEDVRLPVPSLDGSSGDCLCRECLRVVAATQA